MFNLRSLIVNNYAHKILNLVAMRRYQALCMVNKNINNIGHIAVRIINRTHHVYFTRGNDVRLNRFW